MHLAGFEPAIPARERPQIQSFDCSATRIGDLCFFYYLPQSCNLSDDIQQSFWHSLLMACRKYIQWYISYLSSVTNDWVWRGFIDHTQRRITVSRTPLDEWSGRLRDLYLTTHNTHNRQTSMLPVGFETTNPVGEQPQTYALDHVATWIGIIFNKQ